MMRNEATWLIQLGAAVERADNTARLVDVKYHLLLPGGRSGRRRGRPRPVDDDPPDRFGGHRLSLAVREGLQPANVIDLLISRFELPRSLAACVEETVQLLSQLAKRTGLQGEADRMARARMARMQKTRTSEVIVSGLHEYLEAFIHENAMLNAAIARQFRFI
jgi:uncharacterized alpha-E superfamily protein